jgi:hypothetical protein
MVGVNGWVIGVEYVILLVLGMAALCVVGTNLIVGGRADRRFWKMRTEFLDRIMNTKEIELENKSTGEKKVFIDKELPLSDIKKLSEIIKAFERQISTGVLIGVKEAPSFLGEYLEKRHTKLSTSMPWGMDLSKTQHIDTEEHVSRLEQRLLTLEIALDNFKSEARKKIGTVKTETSNCFTRITNADRFAESIINNTNAIDGRLCAIEAKLANPDDGK